MTRKEEMKQGLFPVKANLDGVTYIEMGEEYINYSSPIFYGETSKKKKKKNKKNN